MSSFIINPYRFGVKNASYGTNGTQIDVGNDISSGGTSTLTGISTGDLVLALVQRGVQSAITGVTCDGTSMTNIKRNEQTSNQFGIDAWGWIADRAISSAAITASYSGNSTFFTINTMRWSGVASTTPLTSSCNSGGCTGLATSSTNRLAQSITTSERSLIIACGTDWDDKVTHTAQSGWTKRLDGSGTPFTTVQFLFDRVSDAGTFGGATAFSTVAASGQYLSMLLAFPLA